MNATIKKPIGLVIKDEDLHLFAPESAKDVFVHEKMLVDGHITKTSQAYSLDGIKALLSNEEYFSSLVDFMQDHKKAKVNIAKIRDLSLAINKNSFVMLIEQLLKEHKLDGIRNIKSKLKILKECLALETIVDGKDSYTTNVRGKEITIPTQTIMDFLQFDARMLNFENITSLYGYDPKEFVYAVRKFTDEYKLHTNCLMDEGVFTLISMLKQDQLVDTMSLEAVNETKDNTTPVGLHPELVKYIFENMRNDYTDLEKAIFVYLKLAKVFTYDDEFYAEQQSDEANAKHSNIARLSTITPTNNSVVCYEVNQIFAQILKLLNINYSVDYVLGRYGHGHSNLTFKADDFVVKADAVATILGSDMLNVKVHNDISGLTCQNKNAVMKNKFSATLNKVYDDLKKAEPSRYLEDDSFERWKELLTIFIEDPVDVTIKDKIEIFTKIATKNSLPQTEKIAYLTKIYNRLFSKDKTTYMTIISQKKDEAKFRKPTLIITYNEEDEITKKIDKNQYILLDGEKWTPLTLDSLIQRFSSGELGYISNHLVPGVNIDKKETPSL